MDLQTIVSASAVRAWTLSLAAAIPASWLLLARYRVAVLRSMRQSAGGARDAGPAAVLPRPEAAEPLLDPPRIEWIEGARRVPAESDTHRLALAMPKRAAAVYACAGMVYAAVLTAVTLYVQNFEILPLRFLSIWLTMTWPVVLALCLVGTSSRRARWMALAIFLLTLFFLGLTHEKIWVVLELWARSMWVPTVVLLAVGNRHFRAVGPLLLNVAFLSVLVASAMELLLFPYLLAHTPAWSWSFLGYLPGLGLGLLIAAILLFWVAGRYRRRCLSDQTLILNENWLFFTFFQVEIIFLNQSLWFRGGMFLLAFAVYRLTVWAGFALLRWATPRREPFDLLLLRTFGARRRSERLLEGLGLHWRYVGNIHLIAGSDLATANLEPHELISFLSGRLSREFIQNDGDFARRWSEIDLRPDPDGRYRVHEFFCRDDTWRMVLVGLAEKVDTLVMDLRGFSKQNRGCVFEFHHLIDAVPLSRVILLADESTDTEYLSRTLTEGWRARSPESPNREASSSPIRVLRTSRRRSVGLGQLLALATAGLSAPAPASPTPSLVPALETGA